MSDKERFEIEKVDRYYYFDGRNSKRYVEKGKEIAIEGKITYKSYDGQDGNKKYITEIRVDEILLLGNKN